MTTATAIYLAFMLTMYTIMFAALGWAFYELFKWNEDLEERKRNRKP